jgi:hypothetical protein
MIMAIEQCDFIVTFQQRLKQLRTEIDTVPQEHRPALCQLADQIERRQCRIVDDLATACNLADDLNLGVASTMFDLWACRCDAERIRHTLCGEVA